ncbi:MAG: hypothetical protein LAO04_22855, partial [Acidobacteriia bacterium]|nr:hypothetical protein [Terriglobia bacterium]
LQSEHPTARLSALEILAKHDAPEIVPVLMTHLTPEFKASMTGRDWDACQSFKLICGQLERLTEQNFGDDLLKWVQWWDTAHAKYQAPPPVFPLSAAFLIGRLRKRGRGDRFHALRRTWAPKELARRRRYPLRCLLVSSHSCAPCRLAA